MDSYQQLNDHIHTILYDRTELDYSCMQELELEYKQPAVYDEDDLLNLDDLKKSLYFIWNKSLFHLNFIVFMVSNQTYFEFDIIFLFQ